MAARYGKNVDITQYRIKRMINVSEKHFQVFAFPVLVKVHLWSVEP